MFGHRARRTNGQHHDAAGTLAVLRAGDHATIEAIEDDSARAQAIRFGMGAGAAVQCVTTLPGGPIVLRSGRQEIAVGRGLARQIRIQGSEVRRECA